MGSIQKNKLTVSITPLTIFTKNTLVMDEPGVVHWSQDDVCKWVIDLGFPQYEQCFRSNFVDGRKLILIDGSTLPNLGIQDFEHIKIISSDIKSILQIPKDQWDRSISLEEAEPLALYYLEKSKTGRYSNMLTLDKFTNKRAQKERLRKFQ